MTVTTNVTQTKTELATTQQLLSESKEKCQTLEHTIQCLTEELGIQRSNAIVFKKEVEDLQIKCQQMKVERNSFKQKSDSLAKEMSRLTRNGMELVQIERIMHDNSVLRTEMSTLKSQKKKLADELEELRVAYKTSLQAQVMAGLDGEAVRALEQRVELERVLKELTEYVHAKEMQLETLKEVNRALTDELQKLLAHQAQTKNLLGENDV